MGVYLLGVNHRTAGVALRERLHFSPEEGLRAATKLRNDGVVDEVVVLSTCNRSEVYTVAADTRTDVESGVERNFCVHHAVEPEQ